MADNNWFGVNGFARSGPAKFDPRPSIWVYARFFTLSHSADAS